MSQAGVPLGFSALRTSPIRRWPVHSRHGNVLLPQFFVAPRRPSRAGLPGFAPVAGAKYAYDWSTMRRTRPDREKRLVTGPRKYVAIRVCPERSQRMSPCPKEARPKIYETLMMNRNPANLLQRPRCAWLTGRRPVPTWPVVLQK